MSHSIKQNSLEQYQIQSYRHRINFGLTQGLMQHKQGNKIKNCREWNGTFNCLWMITLNKIRKNRKNKCVGKQLLSSLYIKHNLLLGCQKGAFQFSHTETNHTRALNDPDGKPFVKAFEISTIVLFHGWILVGVLLQSVMLKQSVKLSSREMTEERTKGNEHTQTPF